MTKKDICEKRSSKKDCEHVAESRIPINEGAVVLEPGSTLKNKTGNWRTQRPVLDSEKCIRCGKCWAFCPDGAFLIVEDKSHPKGFKLVIDYSYCKGCGICAEECPVKAIKIVEEEK